MKDDGERCGGWVEGVESAGYVVGRGGVQSVNRN